MDNVKWLWFGRIYTAILVLVTLPLIYFMIQYFFAVPQLRTYFYLDLLVPIIGFGVGIYGLKKTKGQE